MKSLFPESITTSSSLSLEGIATKIVYFKLQFHLIHWQTNGLAEHGATGEIYTYLEGFLDGIIEKLMGYCGRRIGAFKLEPLGNVVAMNLASDLADFATSLKQYGETNRYHDICNMADELSGSANKLKYLLTLS